MTVRTGLYGALIMLLASLLVLRFIAPGFEYGTLWLDRPTVAGVALMMAAGLSFCASLYCLHKLEWHRPRIGALIVFGLLLRLMWIGTTPIFEDDFYRYFWDGALIAHGKSPYLTAPADAYPPPLPATIGGETPDDDDVDPLLLQIRETGYVDRVAYPYVKTIYPPVAQAMFFLSYKVSPWSLDTWRLLLILTDCLSLFLLFKLIALFHRPKWAAMIFWLNPLIITETVNAGHMDALLLPFLIGAVLLAKSGKYGRAGMALAGAVGVKLWPVILAPILFARLLTSPTKNWRALTLGLGALLLTTLFLLYPQILARLEPDTGLVSYSENWQTNAFLFSQLDGVLSAILDDDTALLSRIIVFLTVCILVAWRTFTGDVTHKDHMTRGLMIVTASLYLLSPTGYPWYIIWFIPWLALHPSPALLLLTVTLPLYDLRYPLSVKDDSTFFDDVIVPLEFAPVLLLMAMGAVGKLKRLYSDQGKAH